MNLIIKKNIFKSIFECFRDNKQLLFRIKFEIFFPSVVIKI
jgi:hypothetical protein